jgi:hypothetical protein
MHISSTNNTQNNYYSATITNSLYANEEDKARAEARRIGPFCFEIDPMIDTEVLADEQVHDDLKELKDILD